MTPKELHERCAKTADTDKRMSHVTAADVSRSISIAFQHLSALPADECSVLIGKLMTLGSKARSKARAKKKKR